MSWCILEGVFTLDHILQKGCTAMPICLNYTLRLSEVLHQSRLHDQTNETSKGGNMQIL